MKPAGRDQDVRRIERQREILKSGMFFKMICGAGNEDAAEVYKLALVFALAGAQGIDVSAQPNVVLSARRGIRDAREIAPRLGLPVPIDPYITVSVGMPGDPHVRKARVVVEACTRCSACIAVCPADAIPASLVIIDGRCIGCGACGAACQDDAIAYRHKELELARVLRECLAAGAENIELHAAVPDHESTMIEWDLITRVLPDGFVGVCLDRGYLSNHDLRRRIERMLAGAEGRMIVQADGIPMSGGRDDYNTTLQAVATADIIAKMNLPVHILLSGGTNSKTLELAAQCGLSVAGVSIGTFARHLVYRYINDPAFSASSPLLSEAIAVATKLVKASLPLPAGRQPHNETRSLQVTGS